MRRHVNALYLAFVMVFLGGSVLSQVQADPVIYSQPSDFPAGGIFFSINDTSQTNLDATVFDNFTLLTTASVTDVHWQGAYLLGESPGDITAFTITFWSDNGGQPGNALLTESFLGNANETPIGNDNGGIPTFNYAVDLTTPFQATGGTQYWLSIVPDLAFPPVWGWHTGTGGDGIAFINFLGAPSFLTSDLAFDLTGTVPEPGSLSLISLGIVGLIAHRWRRRHTD